jgi:A/G-specific adenine glycosylase
MTAFATQLIQWQHKNGRHHLPWQGTRDPYAIWLSEIMLQQTQVNTVIPYYDRFMQSFPSIKHLAQAPLDAVLALWSGLGYYSRARNLHQAACMIMQDYQGNFPQTRTLIQQLPGIGRSTAAAIAVFAYGKCEAILDGNVKRVFTRYFGIAGYPGESKTQNQLWRRAEEHLPHRPHGNQKNHIETYTQALMDLGATICTQRKPICTTCPLQKNCVAFNDNRIEQLPTPKIRKPMPRKEAIFLILLQHQKILLEKRPTSGIWGGLWSLPELGIDENVTTYCQQHLGMRVSAVNAPTPLPSLDHQFTHFKLRIHPQFLQVISQNAAKSSLTTWLKPHDALKYAIPTPVRKLLELNCLTENAHFNHHIINKNNA